MKSFHFVKKLGQPIKAFIRMEASGGIILFFTAVVAMLLANSTSLSSAYEAFIMTPVGVTIGSFILQKNYLLLVNDGLMAIFFFLIGLEIKREVMIGELKSIKEASFSIFAAIGGMIIPALIYFSMNQSGPGASGWGIPMATDIAFALGVLSLLGSRVPTALKVFLLALAIVDDLGAITVIALFYTETVAFNYLGIAGLLLLAFHFKNVLNINSFFITLLLGFFTWFCFLKSGVHATIAGVLLALLVPAYTTELSNEGEEVSVFKLDHYIHQLHPWIAFAIMPIFAFFNSGINMQGIDILGLLREPVALGIILGLSIGKPVGILIFTWIPLKLKIISMPTGVSFSQIIAIGFIAGIGFTMSLFISGLAFDDNMIEVQSKVGIVVGSLISMVLGFILLLFSLKPSKS